MTKIPKWIFIFIAIGLMIPILSIEGVIPWIIFFFLSKKCINIGKSNMENCQKIYKCALYTASIGLMAFILALCQNIIINKLVYIMV